MAPPPLLLRHEHALRPMAAGELRELLRDLPEAADRVLGEAAVGTLDLYLLLLVRQVEIDDEKRLEVVVVLRDYDAGLRIVVIKLHRKVRVRFRGYGLPDGPEQVPADDPHEIVRVEVLHGHDVRGLDDDLRGRLGLDLRRDDLLVALLPPPHDDRRSDDIDDRNDSQDSKEQLHGWLLPVGLPCPNWPIISGFYLQVKLTAQAEVCVRTGIGGPIPVRIVIPFASADHVAVQVRILAVPGRQPVISRTQLHRCRKSVLILLLAYPRFDADLIARGQQIPDRIRIICAELQITCGTAV